jgi:hypothetical protein
MGFLLQHFNYYFNISCPKVRRNTASASKVPWINKDAVTSRTKLKDLYDLYMHSKIQEYRDIYKACKKEYNVIMKTAKANYIQNIITRSNNTPKVLREFANRERGSPNNTLTCNIHLQEGNEIVSSPSRTPKLASAKHSQDRIKEMCPYKISVVYYRFKYNKVRNQGPIDINIPKPMTICSVHGICSVSSYECHFAEHQ